MTRSNKYPSGRKSPGEHTVKAHLRNGRRVRSFTRGSGKVVGAVKRVGRVVGRGIKGAGKRAAYEADRRHKEKMLERCFKGTRAQKVAARYALKRHYPELWEEAGFGDEYDKRRKAPEVVFIQPKMVRQRR